MEDSRKRCTNCGKFPLCEYFNSCKYGFGREDKWIKRETKAPKKFKDL